MVLTIHTFTQVGLLPEKRMSVLASSLVTKKEKCGSVVSPQSTTVHSGSPRVLYCNDFLLGKKFPICAMILFSILCLILKIFLTYFLLICAYKWNIYACLHNCD